MPKIYGTFDQTLSSDRLASSNRIVNLECQLNSFRLHAKAPDDAAAFKSWLREISQKVAEAAAEGSILGFGGVRVSDAEKATLRNISTALGMAP